ncbi:MAG: hypothetical protein WBG42_11415, partial [Cryomorphaceae bacterium]
MKKYHFSSRWVTILFLASVLFVWTSCKKDSDDEEVNPLCETVSGGGTPYEFEKPFFFPDPIIPADNPFTEEGIE